MPGPVSDASDELPIEDEHDNHRFALHDGDAVAELVYDVRGNRLRLIHTEVPEALGGRGIAAALVRAAVQRARDEELVLVPSCPYARRWLEKNPDATEGITIDWS